MGDLIHIEQLRIAREEQLRRRALRQFPWEEMERVRMRGMDPLLHRWPDAKRVILLEMAYRLAYESFLSGIRRAAGGEGPRGEPVHPGRAAKAAKALVRRIMKEFSAERWLEETWTETVELLLIQLAENWYKKGWAAGLARS